MGFFSPRRTDSSSPPPTSSPPNLAQLIRSRFREKARARYRTNFSQHSAEYALSIPAAGESLYTQEHFRGDVCTNQSFQTMAAERSTLHSSTNAITATLAQRLDELATANAEGLLSDDEYRALRQNVFECFAPVSTVPTETPLVKSAGPSGIRPPSSFCNSSATTHSIHSPSLRTQSSIGSSMSNMLRRATGRMTGRRVTGSHDGISIMSSLSRVSSSSPPVTLSHIPARQSSSSSLRTQRLRHVPSDLRSVSSRRSGKSAVFRSDAGGKPQSDARSLRGGEAPPSSFTAKHLTAPATVWGDDEGRLRSTADIRAEIRFIEEEERRILKAFNVLELSTVDRYRNDCPADTPSNGCREGSDPTWALISEQYPTKHELTGNGRDHSMSAPVSFDTTDCATMSVRGFATSNLREHSGARLEAELGHISRRRMEVTERYQQRLGYLKARLKGVEIHERLMRK
ncbi:hypothetical protein M0805_001557 [Coniferiporia weirii]|nr:hypothetical protein M0805_001557 [Coniferiporia weirii]